MSDDRRTILAGSASDAADHDSPVGERAKAMGLPSAMESKKAGEKLAADLRKTRREQMGVAQATKGAK